jgi:hypothetical protein
MKTKQIFGTLLLCASLIAFGCKQTTAPLMATGGEWVEITDTMSMQDIQGLSSVFSRWKYYVGLAIRDTAEYQALASMVDTTNSFYKPIHLPLSPDFSLYSMVGMRTIEPYVTHRFYVNDTLQQYRYNVHLHHMERMHPSIPFYRHNWLRVPRLKSGYTVVFDTTMSQLD